MLAPDGLVRRSRLPEVRSVERAAPTTPRGGFAIETGLPWDDVQRAYVKATVDALGGNRGEAARRLGVSRNTIARALDPKK